MKKFLKYLLLCLIAIVLVFVLFYKFWFLRQPARHVPHDNHVFVSPANGKVVSVTSWNKDYLAVTKGKYGLINVWAADVDTSGYMVSIQMDPTHVHYQRSPIDAKIISHSHIKGSFNNALGSDNPYGIRFENEHNEILIQANDSSRYKIIQIAGFMARRIEDYVKPDQDVKQGDVIGLIKLGSQVTVILPHNTKVNVQVGQTVIDGETVIGDITAK
ncbi:MAG: phosphatidylserine decarboxylase [Bacteroidetes bacterium]|nr:phosphatidylserine decarboxylase [Bacteroidota bacterium]